MGENSEPKPESDVMLRKSLTIGLKKSGFEKSLSLGLKKFSLEKRLSLGLEKFGLKNLGIGLKKIISKKVSVSVSEIFVLKKVSVSVSDEISGLDT